jgi:hypothetical protein
VAAAALVAFAVGAGWIAAPGSAAVRHCKAVTVPARVTETLPVTYADMTASGVTCTYVDSFVHDISRIGAAPPSGWNIKVAKTPAGVIEDICKRGKEAITFSRVRPI